MADSGPATDTRPLLSCYIRAQNEAHRITPVITAALRVAREVVVVDSGSTDGTQQVAETAGARVITQKWLGNGYQKRVGEEACQHDWLLDLDADEVLDDTLVNAILALFANAEPPNPVYALKLVTYPPDTPPWTNFGTAYRNKLYDRRRIRMPESPAWDQFKLPGAMRAIRLPGTIKHFAFSGISQLAQKANSVSTSRATHTKPRPMWQLRLRIYFAYPFYFVKHYFIRGLCRAGTYGFIVSAIAAHARWLRDAKMYEIELRKKLGKKP